MNDDRFFEPFEMQEVNHCGPTSLGMCLGILGIYADQRDLARAAGKPWRVYATGLDEKDLKKAAAKYGVKCEYVSETDRRKGQSFVRRLATHLNAGNPLVLLTLNFNHWVAVIGWAKERCIIFDPLDNDLAFSRWSERTLLRKSWNETEDDEPDAYFAILTSRKDGKPARWNPTEAFLDLCEKGSEEAAETMANDLIEMAGRAATSAPKGRTALLADILADEKRAIVDSVVHWTASDAVDDDDIEELYDDYTAIAGAAGIRVPASTSRSALVAQVTAVLAAFAWNDEL